MADEVWTLTATVREATDTLTLTQGDGRITAKWDCLQGTMVYERYTLEEALLIEARPCLLAGATLQLTRPAQPAKGGDR